MWKDGLRKTAQGKVQRLLCRDCGWRFGDTTAQLDLAGQDIRPNYTGQVSDTQEEKGDSNLPILDADPTFEESIEKSPLSSRAEYVESHDLSYQPSIDR